MQLNIIGGVLVFVASIAYSYSTYLSKTTRSGGASFKWPKFIRTLVIGLIAGGYVAIGNISASQNLLHNTGVGMAGGIVTVLADQGSKGIYRLLNGFTKPSSGN